MVTWGPDDAFFAMSEYGDVAYRLGDKKKEDWAIWRETVEDWKTEKAFRWNEVAYIALDPTTPDQFVAIRNDGTWSGSISDDNSSALTSFAHNFFRLAKPKSKSKSPPPRTHENTNGTGSRTGNNTPKQEDIQPDPATKAAYTQWSNATNLLFASALAATTPSNPTPTRRAPKKLQIRSQSSSTSIPKPVPPTSPSPSPNSSSSTAVPHANLLTSFPYLPPTITICPLPVCALQKADPAGLRACKHDVEKLLRGSESYGYEWLKKERVRWHPDRFGRLCEEAWREEGKRLSEEMFKVVDILLGELEDKGERQG